MSKKSVPSEFTSLLEDVEIPWEEIIETSKKRIKKKMKLIEAFTDTVVEMATKESMKKTPSSSMIALGLHACLVRGRLAEALFLSDDIKDIKVLSLRAVVLFVLSEVDGLRNLLEDIEAGVTEESPAEDRVRLSTTKVLLSAAERDTSVIVSIMEFDKLLEENPEQVEEPLIETMFTLYVVGTLLREVGQALRAVRIADTLEDMAKAKKHRMFIALVENLRGHISNLQGDFKKAEEHYLKLNKISEELSFDLGIAMALNNLGTLRINSLRFEDALEYFKSSLDMMKVESGKIVSLANMGEISTILGRHKEAEEFLKEGIRLDKKLQRGTIEVYTWYSVLLSRTGRIRESTKYLEKAEEIWRTTERPLQKGAYLFSRGIHQSSSNNLDSAIDTFEELLTLAKDNALFEFLVRAELELASTYVRAFIESESVEHISKAAYHLNDLITLSNEQGLQTLYAEALLIRSDMYALADQRFEAKSDLERVISVSSFIEDPRLEKQARSKLKIFSSDEIAALKLERADLTKSLDRLTGFKPAAGKLKEIPTPSLHSLIVLDRGSGLPVFVYHFDSTLEMDSSMIGGFISAITAFSDELLGDMALLRSINHEGFTVMMEYSSERIVTLIADQETFDVRFMLRTFGQRFNKAYPMEVTNRGVAPSEYEGAEIIVKKVFSGTALSQDM
ncbi:MAG: tetratricopeptide repeat protein [Candidatus Thorarchaeota archaeon]